MRLSPRVRAYTNAGSRLPSGAIVPLLGTCALTAGIGVGVLYGAAHVGNSRSQDAAAPPPTVVVQPPPAPTQAVPAIVAVPVDAGAAGIAGAPSRPSPFDDLPARPLTPTAAASGGWYDAESSTASIDPSLVAAARVDDEQPFLAVPVKTPAPAPVQAERPSTTTSAAGRLAKIAPSSDGLPARLRAQPTTTAKIVARVPSGTPIRVLGPADSAGDWLRVSWNGITAYVYADLIR